LDTVSAFEAYLRLLKALGVAPQHRLRQEQVHAGLIAAGASASRGLSKPLKSVRNAGEDPGGNPGTRQSKVDVAHHSSEWMIGHHECDPGKVLTPILVDDPDICFEQLSLS